MKTYNIKIKCKNKLSKKQKDELIKEFGKNIKINNLDSFEFEEIK